MLLSSLPRDRELNHLSQNLVKPDPINGTYKDDYDIIEIHKIMLRNFQYEQQVEIQELRQQAEIIEKKLAEADRGRYVSVNDRRDFERRLQELRDRISRISNNENKKNYVSLCGTYLKLYQELKIFITSEKFDLQEFIDQVSSTFGDRMPQIGAENIYSYRHELIRLYIENARHFFEINLTRIYEDNAACACGYMEDFTKNASGSRYCPECGEIKPTFVRTFTGMDLGITVNRKDKYNDISGFVEKLAAFQGRPKKIPPASIYDALDVYFSAYSYPTRQVGEVELDDRGRLIGTTKTMMRDALSATKNSAYYDYIDYICQVYWKWKLPNFSQDFEDMLIWDYTITQTAFGKMNKDRDSNVLGWWRLYKHLQARGYPCHKDDFKIIASQEIISEYDALWKSMIETAEYPPDYPHEKLQYISSL